MFVVYKQPPSNDKLAFSGIVLYTRLVFLLCACSMRTYCPTVSACVVIYNITPLLRIFGKSKDIFALPLSLHNKEYGNSMSTVCAYCIYASRYCKATKEGGREWRSSNRYYFAKFAYNRPCFYTQRATLVLQIAKKPILCFGQNRTEKIPIVLGRLEKLRTSLEKVDVPRNTESVFLNVYGAQASIPRNEFRQPM
jgi:hypothetical protein